MLLPWTDWRGCFPELALQGWTSSSQWADAFEKVILGKLKDKFKDKGVMWPVFKGENVYQILYVHLLDQSRIRSRERSARRQYPVRGNGSTAHVLGEKG